MQQMWKLYIWFLIFLSNNNVIWSKKNFKPMKFLQTQVAFNTSFLSDHQFKINPDRTSINITLDIARNFTRDVWVQLGVHHQRSKMDTSYRSLFSYDINVCQLLGKKTANNEIRIAQLWINNFMKYGTLPHSCPILKGNYYWYNLKTDKMALPTYLISGRYRLIVNTYFPGNELTNQMPTISVANLTISVEFK